MTDFKRDSRKKNNKGFTLVELIVVLIILALLAAILAPALLGFIDNAKREKEAANAKSLLNAVQNKLSALYDQGLMPNLDNSGLPNDGSDGFIWKEDWSGDVVYNSGLEERPYICGFFTGNLTEGTGGGNYCKAGLSGLKKGYKVYAFVYVESEDSKPVIFYNGDWDLITLSGVMDDSSIVVSDESGEYNIYRSRMCAIYGCTGGTDAAGAYGMLRDTYKAVP